jgi:hypothetical protein
VTISGSITTSPQSGDISQAQRSTTSAFTRVLRALG